MLTNRNVAFALVAILISILAITGGVSGLPVKSDNAAIIERDGPTWENDANTNVASDIEKRNADNCRPHHRHHHHHHHDHPDEPKDPKYGADDEGGDDDEGDDEQGDDEDIKTGGYLNKRNSHSADNCRPHHRHHDRPSKPEYPKPEPEPKYPQPQPEPPKYDSGDSDQ